MHDCQILVVLHHLHNARECACCATDPLVVEMLLEVEDKVLEVLDSTMRERLCNRRIGHGDVAWDEHLVRLLKKKGFSSKLQGFRPIAVLPALYNVYSRILLMPAERRVEKRLAPQFVFRSGYQAHEVVFILRNIIEKA